MCYEIVVVVVLRQYLIQSCARGGRRLVEDMCYAIRRAEAGVNDSDHRTLVSRLGIEPNLKPPECGARPNHPVGPVEELGTLTQGV